MVNISFEFCKSQVYKNTRWSVFALNDEIIRTIGQICPELYWNPITYAERRVDIGEAEKAGHLPDSDFHINKS